MTLFWIVTGLLSLALAALLAIALLRGQRDTGPAEAFDLQVYRDQLAEVDRDLARGVISPEDAERLRTEISRRILAADAKARQVAEAGGAPKVLGMTVAGAVVLGILGGGFGLYRMLGAPGYGDLSLQSRIEAARELRATRPGQAEAETQAQMPKPEDVPAQYTEMVEKLRAAVAERPDDLQGHVLLARSEAALGNYVASYKAQQRVIELRGDEVTADDYITLADGMILAAGGYVSPEAEAALNAGLRLDPNHGVGLYYTGLMMAQTGRPDVAFRIWDGLLRTTPQDSPWTPPILSQIEEVAFRAGVANYKPPVVAPGPSAEDMRAAADMSDAERQDMIRGMVERLAERLDSEGGSPAEWSRLISSLAVLGDKEGSDKALADARAAFAGNPAALEQIEAAAQARATAPGTDAGAAMPGPSQQQVEDAAGMDSGGRQAMIKGMVQRLSDRLATEGGSPEEWARLVSSLGVLGDEDAAAKALADARLALEGDAEGLAQVEAAARKAGLGQ